MKIPCKNIPTYHFDKKKWTTTSFDNQYDFKDFLVENCFKEPGEYNFHKELVIDLWTEQAQKFSKENKYTDFAPDTEEYTDYWNNEELKCRLGVIWYYKDKIYYTTNDYYFFLNFFLMLNKEIGFVKTFPTVRDVQYHMMLYEKIAELSDLNSCILKRRQMAFSNCHTAKSLCMLYFEYDKRIKWGASDAKFVLDPINGTWFMVDIAINHLNEYTGWYRSFSPQKPGSLMQRVQVQEDGKNWKWEGNNSSLVFNSYAKDPAAGVGGPTTMAYYEEGGIAPTADLTLQFLEPAIQSGGKRVGTFIIGGSVGDLDQCAPLKRFTLKPNTYGFLGVNTKWYNKDGLDRICGLFIPAQYGMPEATDEHGNSQVALAIEILEKSEKKGWKAGDKKGNITVQTDEEAWNTLPEGDFILKKSQNPRTVEEAFAFRKASVFNIQRIEKRQKTLEILIERKEKTFKQGLLYVDSGDNVRLKELKEYQVNEAPIELKYPIDPKIIDKRGLVTIVEEYKTGCEYFAGVDSIEADKTNTSESVFSIHIYRRSYTEFDKYTNKQKIVKGRLVAWWAGRFDSLEETNDHGMYLLKMYKAKASCERNKPNFINHCRRNGLQSLIALTKDLPFDKDIDISGRENGSYGVHRDSGGKVLKELIRTGKEYFNSEINVIYTESKEGEDIGKIKQIIRGYDEIDDYWLLEELKKYNEEDNFDRVDSALYAIHYGTAEELSFQNKLIQVDTTPEKKDIVYKPKPQTFIKKYNTAVKKFGYNRSLL